MGRVYIPTEPNGVSGAPGSKLPRNDWTALNRVRTNHCRCADSLFKWNTLPGLHCNCGAPRQTIRLIVSECPLRVYEGEWSDFLGAAPEALQWIKNSDIQLLLLLVRFPYVRYLHLVYLLFHLYKFYSDL